MNDSEISALAEAFDHPGHTPASAPSRPAGWHPDLNPTQEIIFNDASNFILAYGEKGSGKTIGLLHRLTRHCYENRNALALIISPSIRTGAEGVLFDLESLVLPAWKEGIDLEVTASRLDPNTKDRHLWIANRFGGWSKVLLVSIPYAEAVEPRIKAIAPSFIYVDELTNCKGREYFTYPAAQLNRRRDIEGPQQYTASCNPEGPSHWVYHIWFDECVDEDTGSRDSAFAVHHVPISENLHRLPQTYLASLERILAHDPIEQRRLIHGEWVDRPSGTALFKEYFQPHIHVKGDALSGHGLLPVKGHPIAIGYDLGQVNSSITFLQHVPTRDRLVWMVFDEVDSIGVKVLYKWLVKRVVERMDYWREKVGYNFKYIHISDDSAINQWHPGGSGSFDAWDVERFSDGQIKLIPCPKGKGSVEARVRLLSAKLFQEEIFISAVCTNTTDMLIHLNSDKQNPTKPRRSKYLHKFDSLTYPIFKLEFNGTRNILPSAQVRPNIITCGTG
jgi:hypothetical protein